jgi:plasmid stability protein
MGTLTVRNLRPRLVKSLKVVARKNRHSMEQEVCELLGQHLADRASILRQIEAGWAAQARRPTAEEVDRWLLTSCFPPPTCVAQIRPV